MGKAVHQRINCKVEAKEASKVLGETFVLLEKDNSFTWAIANALPYLNYKRILFQFKEGQARRRYA